MEWMVDARCNWNWTKLESNNIFMSADAHMQFDATFFSANSIFCLVCWNDHFRLVFLWWRCRHLAHDQLFAVQIHTWRVNTGSQWRDRISILRIKLTTTFRDSFSYRKTANRPKWRWCDTQVKTYFRSFFSLCALQLLHFQPMETVKRRVYFSSSEKLEHLFVVRKLIGWTRVNWTNKWMGKTQQNWNRIRAL